MAVSCPFCGFSGPASAFEWLHKPARAEAVVLRCPRCKKVFAVLMAGGRGV